MKAQNSWVNQQGHSNGKKMKVVGYIRVSTEEQAELGAGLEAQRRAIALECERRGWDLVEIFEDAGFSGKSVEGRSNLDLALKAVRGKDIQGMVVARLDRLSRSLMDFASLMADAKKRGWNLVALDLGVDLSTPAGEFLANVLASAAQWERRIIGERTKEAMAVKKSQGVKFGRRSLIDVAVRQRIQRERDSGYTLAKIADDLNSDRVPTGQGGTKWYASSVKAVLKAA